jgi:serine/threonine-protein kinase RsbW
VTPIDDVRLVVPAGPEFLRLVRLTVASLAGRLGFSYDEVEDVCLATSELCFGLIGPTGRRGTVEVVYVIVDEGALIVEGIGHFLEDIVPITLTDLSRIILGALVDEYDLSAGPNGPHFRLVKRHGSRGDGGAGVREPRRPFSPSGGAAAALEGPFVLGS